METLYEKSVALLSGGLDSLVSIGLAKKLHDIRIALTFDYGQRTAQQEIKAASSICKHYSIKHRVINLPWLADITSTSLVNRGESLPELDNSQLDNPEFTEKSAKAVWVPNRNGVFINIAGSFADSMELKYIIFGANKEEAATFPDNSKEFISKMNYSLFFSTLVKVEVIAPLADSDKREIVKTAVENDIPLHLVRSCYTDHEIHCGKCESCLRLKRALSHVFGNNYPVEFAG